MKYTYEITSKTRLVTAFGKLASRLGWPMWSIKIHARALNLIDSPWYDGHKWTRRIKAN